MATSFPNHRDARYWRFGFIYHNPQDPNLFVERRFSQGLTVNFGHKGAIGFLAALLVPPAVVIAALLIIAQ